MRGAIFTQRSAKRIADTVRDNEARRLAEMQFVQSPPIPNIPPVRKFGIIMDHGPAGEDDFENEVYWVSLAHVVNGFGPPQENDPIEIAEFEQEHPSYGIVRATNLAELQEHSHEIAVDTVVSLYVAFDKNDPSEARHYFTAGGGGGVGMAVLYEVTDHPFIVRGREVRPVNAEAGEYAIDDDIVEFTVWPFVDTRFYKALIWTGDVNQDIQILPTLKIGPARFIMQWLRWPLAETLPAEHRYSECNWR